MKSKVTDFDDIAALIYAYQLQCNPVLAEYYKSVKDHIQSPYAFLPVSFFKTHRVVSGSFKAVCTFKSSATTGQQQALHHVANLDWYEYAFLEGFKQFYGDPSQYCILALLPSYLERQDSSLVYMCSKLISFSGHPLSGFYLYNFDELAAQLNEARRGNKRVLLIGVSFALLDFAYHFQEPMPDVWVMETGGMKGRKREYIRGELHHILQSRWQMPHIHSEYGMTEMLSQAYALEKGLFACSKTCKVYITDPYDPLTLMPHGKAGLINVVDLANIHSCSFLQTSDLGISHADGTFEVLGRTDYSDTRGCNLLYV